MKILTYKDPTAVFNNSDGIGDIIERVPHFCASEVLVQGMIAQYGRKHFTCIATIDAFVKNLFPNWLLNQESKAERLLEVSSIINELIDDAAYTLEKARIVDDGDITLQQHIVSKEAELKILRAFAKNTRGIVDAIIYLWETETPIEASEESQVEDEQDSEGHTQQLEGVEPQSAVEQVLLQQVIKRILQNKVEYGLKHWDADWQVGMGQICAVEAVRTCLVDEIRKVYRREVDRDEQGSLAIKRENALAWLRRDVQSHKHENEEKVNMLESLKDSGIESKKRIVFQGLYKMKPIHFKTFELLEEMGYEVVLLNCYNPEYPKVYALWQKLYSALSEHYKISEVRIGTYSDGGVKKHDIGTVYGDLVEGRALAPRKETIDKCEFVEYLTTMQFINNVSQVFDRTVDEEGKYHIGAMDEQFYGVNGIELNEVFRIFYPELFKQKSFMSFPLGQFIYYLHDMWQDGELVLHETGLVECLNMYGENAIEVYYKVKVYIGLERQKSGLSVKNILRRLRTIQKCSEYFVKQNPEVREKVAHFGYILPEQEYIVLEQALLALQQIAQQIFGQKAGSADEHYSKLVSMIEHLNKEPQWQHFEKEESELLEGIRNRLEILSENTQEKEAAEGNKKKAMQVDIGSLKDTITVYLKGSVEQDELSWLVRDFEQIDGDLLLFNAPGERRSKAETVHYSLVSNQNMLQSTASSGVWPLTQSTVRNQWVWQTRELIAGNDQAYKRCMLFQGLYYMPSRVKVKLSYVKNVANLNNEEKEHDAYFLMEGIRNHYKQPTVRFERDLTDSTTVDACDQKQVAYTMASSKQEDAQGEKVMAACPYRYMYSTALNKPAYVYNQNPFLVEKYFEEYMKYRIKKFGQLRQSELLSGQQLLPEEKWLTEEKWLPEARRIMGDICTDKQIKDIVKHAYQQKEQTYPFREDILYCWGKQVKEQQKPVHYPTTNEPWKYRLKEYGASERVRTFLEETWDGFEETDNKKYMVSEHLCEYCSQKNLCLYPYRLESKNLIRKNGEE